MCAPRFWSVLARTNWRFAFLMGESMKLFSSLLTAVFTISNAEMDLELVSFEILKISMTKSATSWASFCASSAAFFALFAAMVALSAIAFSWSAFLRCSSASSRRSIASWVAVVARIASQVLTPMPEMSKSKMKTMVDTMRLLRFTIFLNL